MRNLSIYFIIKPIFSTLFIFLLIKSGTAQPGNSFNLPYQYIDLEQEFYSGNENFNFYKIKILDARADTTKMGFINTGSNQNIKLLSFTGGVAKGIENYLNNFYRESFNYTDYSLLIVIRKLWLSKYDTIMKLGTNLIFSGDIYSTKLKLEYYLCNENNYYPITRLDTSVFSFRQNKSRKAGLFLTDHIINSCNKLFTIDTNVILKRKKYTLDQIHEFNRKKQDDPILQTTQYKKGIFATYTEFLTNSPSLDYINVEKDKYGDVLYINDGKGGSYASNKFWGYSDGKDIFITSAKNFFKLYRVQNTFEFYGVKNLRERFNYVDNVLHKRKPALDMFIYQLDMETGEIF